MRVCVTLEHRFHRTPDGAVWTQTQFTHAFWQRYLAVFDGVRCLARVLDTERLTGEWHRADGEGVSFASVPYYVGFGQFVRRAPGVRRAIRDAIRPGDAFVLRVPGNMGGLAWAVLRAAGYPYAVEVTGDPWDLFAPGAIEHPLRPLIRWRLQAQLRRQCAGAVAASYVSGYRLPLRYPAAEPITIASSIELGDHLIAARPRTFRDREPHAPLRLLFVGSLEQYYKGPDVLLRALAACLRRGVPLHLTVVGDGRHSSSLQALARRLRCTANVRFAGQLPMGARICEELDNADLFVLPSRAEGLPRAMIEAMARALPCIGSTVGGFPELLPDDALVPPGDAPALASRIEEVVRDPARMERMSVENLARVRSYRAAVLQARRVGMYRQLRAETERWLQKPSVAEDGVAALADQDRAVQIREL